MIQYRPIQINGESDAIIIWCSKALFFKVKEDFIRIQSIEETYNLSTNDIQVYWGVDPEVEWGYLSD